MMAAGYNLQQSEVTSQHELFPVLPQLHKYILSHVTTCLEELTDTTINLSKDSQGHTQVWNRAHPDLKYRALRLDQHVQYH
jgi:hypothetical protein